MSRRAGKDLSVTPSRIAELSDLNFKIRRVSAQIRSLVVDRDVLTKLFKEFSLLVFDKLSLDLMRKPQGNTDALEFQALRVIIGRTRAAAQFYDITNIPLSVATSRNSSQTRSRLISKLTIHFSRTSAQKKLLALQREHYKMISMSNELGDMIKRFQEDNAALRHEIQTIRNHRDMAENCNDDKMWAQFANVDLLSVSSPQQAFIAGQRRMSSMSAQRKSYTSSKPVVTKQDNPELSYAHSNLSSTSCLHGRKLSFISAGRRSGATTELDDSEPRRVSRNNSMMRPIRYSTVASSSTKCGDPGFNATQVSAGAKGPYRRLSTAELTTYSELTRAANSSSTDECNLYRMGSRIGTANANESKYSEEYETENSAEWNSVNSSASTLSVNAQPFSLSANKRYSNYDSLGRRIVF